MHCPCDLISVMAFWRLLTEHKLFVRPKARGLLHHMLPLNSTSLTLKMYVFTADFYVCSTNKQRKQGCQFTNRSVLAGSMEEKWMEMMQCYFNYTILK